MLFHNTYILTVQYLKLYLKNALIIANETERQTNVVNKKISNLFKRKHKYIYIYIVKLLIIFHYDVYIKCKINLFYEFYFFKSI
jgi:hypothetical protein